MNSNDIYDDDYPTCSETYATLLLKHPNLIPMDITLNLGVAPSFSCHKGDLIRSRTKPAPFGMWELTSENRISSFLPCPLKTFSKLSHTLMNLDEL